jgi:hypothetical protein
LFLNKFGLQITNTNHSTRLERPAKEHMLQKIINYGQNSFITYAPGETVITFIKINNFTVKIKGHWNNYQILSYKTIKYLTRKLFSKLQAAFANLATLNIMFIWKTLTIYNKTSFLVQIKFITEDKNG